MHFLQSPEWQQLQERMGRKTWRVKDVLAVQHALPFGKNYLYVGGAPFDTGACQEIKKIAKQEGAMFLKWEPMTLATSDKRQATSDVLMGAGFHRAFKAVQPQQTIVIDLTRSEEELLAGMHPKTRYNINVGKRHGVAVRKLVNPQEQELEAFVNLMRETAERDGFHTHSPAYYHALAAAPSCEIFVAEYKGGMAAAACVIFFEGTATYLHGGSAYTLRQFMAPYILHWEIIREAKKRGCAQYDLWGIDEQRWPGVTRFKRGFGGKEISHVGSWDFAFHPFLYPLYAFWTRRKR